MYLSQEFHTLEESELELMEESWVYFSFGGLFYFGEMQTRIVTKTTRETVFFTYGS